MILVKSKENQIKERPYLKSRIEAEVNLMNIHERLRFLREKKLHLSARAFGSSINMSGSSITNMEKGTRNITERTIRDICREHHVNSDWLVNGHDPIFNDIVSELDLDIDDEIRHLTHQYSLLNDSDKKLVRQMVNSLSEKINSNP